MKTPVNIPVWIEGISQAPQRKNYTQLMVREEEYQSPGTSALIGYQTVNGQHQA